MHRKFHIGFILIIALILLPIVACQASPTESEPAESAPAENEPADLPEAAEEPEPAAAEPTESPTPAPTETPATNPDDVEVGITNAYQDSFGEWRVVGLLTNAASYAVGDIEAELEFFDEAGESILVQPFYAAGTGLAPTETLAFSLNIKDDLSTMDHFDVNILQLSRLEMNYAPIDLIGGVMHQTENGMVFITGELLNNSDQPVQIDRITASAFNEGGELIYAEDCHVCVRYLGPEGTGPFQMIMYGAPAEVGGPTDFKIHISAVAVSPIESFEIGFSEAEFTFTDNLGFFHVLGDIQNLSDESLDIRLLATLYDADGNALDATTYDLALSTLSSGESVPYDIRFGGLSKGLDFSSAASWVLQLDPYGTRIVEGASVELSTSGDVQTYSDGLGAFTGEVINDTGQALQAVVVLVGLREPGSGQVLGMGNTFIMGEFPEGATAEYAINIILEPGFTPATAEAFIIVRGR